MPRQSIQKVVQKSYGIFYTEDKKKKKRSSLKHIPREKKNTQIVWIPFCNVYTINSIYIVREML